MGTSAVLAGEATWHIEQGHILDVLRTLPEDVVHCVVTSPPYFGLRDYSTQPQVWGGRSGCDHAWALHRTYSESPVRNGAEPFGFDDAAVTKRQRWREHSFCSRCNAWLGSLGLEPTPHLYVQHLVEVFRELRRVLRTDGTCWLVLGDSHAGSWGDYVAPGSTKRGSKQATNRWQRPGYAKANHHTRPPTADCRSYGLKKKDLLGVPWRTAFALQEDGWWLRSDVVWCLSGGTRLYARTQKGEGPARLKDLARLDPSTVQLWNGEKWTQVVAWSRSSEPRDGALEIHLRSGERIGCTAGHVWPTQRRNVRADELRVGDVLLTTRLPEPDRPDSPALLPDIEIGWLAGRYLADGSASGGTVQLACHIDEADTLLARARPLATALHGTAVAHHVGGKGAQVALDGPLTLAAIRAYVFGTSAHNKGLTARAWRRSDTFLRALLEGYLSGDGHYCVDTRRWRLGFTRNDRLASDLRTLCARLGLPLRLTAATASAFGKTWPIYRGDLRLERTQHHNARRDSEVAAVQRSRARQFWDVGVQDQPHLFALAQVS